MNVAANSFAKSAIETNLIAREHLARALLVLLHGLQSVRFLQHFSATHRFTDLPYVAMNGCIVYFVIRRRPADRLDVSWTTRIAVAVGTYVPLLLRPIGESLVPDAVTAAFTLLGILTSLAALVALGRCFGLMPAHRGRISQAGVYGWVRHPMYAGYLISNIGLILAYASWRNLLIFLFSTAGQILRIRHEERVLSCDTEYEAYASRVRWRVIPGVF
jgi:protein-S-isoprenylcysteine O-methyltransferase Ste14